MSPTKSKVQATPPKKNTKAKTLAAESKPPVPSTSRKSSKTTDQVDTTDAVADGLTTANSTGSEKPVIHSEPKVSHAKGKTGSPESVAEGSDTKSQSASAATAPAPGDMMAKERSVKDKDFKASALADESGQTDTAPESAPPAVPAAPATQPADKPMELPKGALIAFRKSGGLKFSSREIVVYPDGRVTYDGGDTAKSALTRAARRMSDAQVVRLRRTLDQINFFGMKPPKTQPDPDGFVIEIAARLGGKNNQLEVNAAGMPGALNSLVDQLTLLLPSEE